MNSKFVSFRRRYLNAALSGDAAEVAQAIDEALILSRDPETVTVEVIMGAQAEIGTLWCEGKISVAEEHLATEIALSELGRLREQIPPGTRIGIRAVVGSVAGDPHTVGARMVADLLLRRGWDVDFLGANTPPLEFAKFVVDRGASLVALSVTASSSLEAARETIRAIRESSPDVRIIVGGGGLNAPGGVEVGALADARVDDPRELIGVARRLLGARALHPDLRSLLRDIGKRVQAYRKGRGWSQNELARAADLDRTYISAVEHGKQNITLGALLRLASALDVSLEEMLLNTPARRLERMETAVGVGTGSALEKDGEIRGAQPRSPVEEA